MVNMRLGQPVCMCGLCFANYIKTITKEGPFSQSEITKIFVTFMKGECPNKSVIARSL
jgi:hypothetical protein